MLWALHPARALNQPVSQMSILKWTNIRETMGQYLLRHVHHVHHTSSLLLSAMLSSYWLVKDPPSAIHVSDLHCCGALNSHPYEWTSTISVLGNPLWSQPSGTRYNSHEYINAIVGFAGSTSGHRNRASYASSSMLLQLLPAQESESHPKWKKGNCGAPGNLTKVPARLVYCIFGW